MERLDEVPALARQAEDAGITALWTSEASHDPFLPLVLAAEHTRRLELGTSIAVAFPRSPMVTAYLAWDLAALSEGRFLLGLGTQVRAHNERRFSVPWGPPVPRLREYVLALRAIWTAWQEGTPLRFEGQHYRHTLMTPFFDPGPLPHPHIPVQLAAVNPALCRLAGEVADGLHVHPFHTVSYIREVILPALREGARRAGRDPAEVPLVTSAFVVTGETPAAVAAARDAVRGELAFYASTRAYRPVLTLHGWEEVGQHLGRLAAAGRWAEMGRLLTDEMLEAFVVVGSYDELPGRLRARRPLIPSVPRERRRSRRPHRLRRPRQVARRPARPRRPTSSSRAPIAAPRTTSRAAAGPAAPCRPSC
ncbi:MAG: TIGR03617 family F420-dependent LLM class oxidoreductase [Deltaproteobacteria bacterium]|nr:TIGR03617 family F420-dependent LLM class oxidoreductase [Deltaproteobacteria bacterium]